MTQIHQAGSGLPQPGDILLDRYVIEGRIDRGGFGAVYRARQLGVDRVVAIKCLDPASIYMDRGAPQRFEKEARLISGLQHPNTITVFDYGCTDTGILFLVMEYLRGVTLNRLVQKGPVHPQRAIHLIRQVLKSLKEAHHKQIIHRDLKPANIMVCEQAGERDVVKVLDFGIAKTLGEFPGMEMDITTELTGHDKLIGTPQYMSPEQIRGDPVSPASDLYSVGLILLEMLTGKPAIDQTNTLVIMGIQLKPEPIRVPLDGTIPAHLVPVLHSALMKETHRRFRTAEEFLQALDPTSRGVATRKVDAEQHIRTEPMDREAIRRMDADGEDLLDGKMPPEDQVNQTGPGVSPPNGRPSAKVKEPASQSIWIMVLSLGIALIVLVGGAVVIHRVTSHKQPRIEQTGSAHDEVERAAAEAEEMTRQGVPSLPEDRNMALQAGSPKIAITFVGSPQRAEVFLGRVNIGKSEEPIELEEWLLPAEIELRRQGYLPQRIIVTPESGPVISYSLERAESRRPESRSAREQDDAQQEQQTFGYQQGNGQQVGSTPFIPIVDSLETGMRSIEESGGHTVDQEREQETTIDMPLF
ncbi:MAG: serine/threonine protein kinase [Bradymonadales bacterium]|nr:serine/threonine protein kinase [Bradymonadales bacterium]